MSGARREERAEQVVAEWLQAIRERPQRYLEGETHPRTTSFDEFDLGGSL